VLSSRQRGVAAVTTGRHPFGEAAAIRHRLQASRPRRHFLVFIPRLRRGSDCKLHPPSFPPLRRANPTRTARWVSRRPPAIFRDRGDSRGLKLDPSHPPDIGCLSRCIRVPAIRSRESQGAIEGGYKPPCLARARVFFSGILVARWHLAIVDCKTPDARKCLNPSLSRRPVSSSARSPS